MERREVVGGAGGGEKRAKACDGFKAPMHLFYLKDSAGYRVDGSLGHEGADLFSFQRQPLDSARHHTAGKQKNHLNKSFNLEYLYCPGRDRESFFV